MKNIFPLLLLLMFCNFLFADLNDGLILDYSFTGNAVDESGTGNDGNVYNAVLTADRFGNQESAYQFGSNRYIQVNSDSTLNLTNKLTMSAWIYLNANSTSWQSIFCKGETSSMNSPYALLIRNYKITFLPNRTEYYSSMSVPTEEWVHVAVVWNGSIIKYYINAVKDDNEDSYTNALNIFNNDLIIGKDAPGAVEWFNGNLDDMRLYNRTLSDYEITQLYRMGNPNIPQNVAINVTNNQINILWDEVSGATYNIYSSDSPDNPFVNWNLIATGITTTNWSSSISDNKKFYKITAVRRLVKF